MNLTLSTGLVNWGHEIHATWNYGFCMTTSHNLKLSDYVLHKFGNKYNWITWNNEKCVTDTEIINMNPKQMLNKLMRSRSTA